MEIVSIEKKNWYADYIVHWKPLNVCNYDCSYCSPENHRSIEVEKLPDINLLLSVADKIKNSIPEGKTLHVNITGGEPFLIPNFNLLLDRLDKHGFLVTVFTNGSMPLRLYEQCFPALKNMIVFVSFHPESADVNKIVTLVTSLRDNGGGVEIRGMMASTLFDKVNDMYSKLNEESITVNRLRVYPLVNVTENKINPPFSSSRDLEDYIQYGDLDIDYYTQEEKEQISALKPVRSMIVPDNIQQLSEDNYFKLSYKFKSGDKILDTDSNVIDINSLNQNRFKGWHCALRSKKIAIFANGDTQYGICGNEGKLGNIFEDELLVFDNLITVCKKDYCGTPDEIMISKWRPE